MIERGHMGVIWKHFKAHSLRHSLPSLREAEKDFASGINNDSLPPLTTHY